jgi:VanZ family protein
VEDVSRGGRLASAWLPLLAYAALVFYFSSRPGGALSRWSFMSHDKLLHAGEYFWFGLLAARALKRSGARLGRAAAGALAVGVAFGASDEYHQTFVPGRQGNDLGDLSADAAGSALGATALVGLAVARRR